MNLETKYKSLSIPQKRNKNVFNAEIIEDFPFARIAVNSVGNPVVLIKSIIDDTFLTQKNVRLKHIELSHNVECKIIENNLTNYENFSVIVFTDKEVNLRKYFFGIAENLIKQLSDNPTQKEVFNIFRNFVEIFRALSKTPSKTVQGIWSELFLISNSEDPNTLLNYWHNIPNEIFDFNADLEKVEVKSSSALERIHIFSSEQLTPPDDKKVIIASLFTKQNSKGQNITDLIGRIKTRITNQDLISKMLNIISTTLGSSAEQGLKIKFDYDLAKNSLKYYDIKDISKIEKINIPSRVSEVKYKSDLTSITPIEFKNLKTDGVLFNAL